MFRTINDDLNDMLGSIFNEIGKNVKQAEANLSADVRETINSFIILADVPGVKKEEIQITFEEGVLKIETPERNFKEMAEGEKILVINRQNFKRVGYFKFKQNINPDTIKATYSDGVLTVEVDKKDKENIRKFTVE